MEVEDEEDDEVTPSPVTAQYDSMTTNLQIVPSPEGQEDEQLRYVKHDLAVDPVSQEKKSL